MSTLFWSTMAWGSAGVLTCCQGRLKTIDEGLLIAAIAVAVFGAYLVSQ